MLLAPTIPWRKAEELESADNAPTSMDGRRQLSIMDGGADGRWPGNFMLGEPLGVSDTLRISLLRLRGSCITSQLDKERGLGLLMLLSSPVDSS